MTHHNGQLPILPTTGICAVGLFAALWLLAAACLGPSQVETQCSDHSVCVITEKSANQVDFFVINHNAYSVTVSLTITSNNMWTQALKKFIDTYPGISRTHAVRLHVDDPGIQWQYHYQYDWVRGSLYAIHEKKVIYDLPYASGQRHRVTQSFNGTFSHFGNDQYAVDFSMPVGTTIHAAREGLVVGIKEDSSTGGASEDYQALGNFVIIEHADQTLGEYFHIKHQGALVRQGQYIQKGDPIALSGDTGHAGGPHLHIGVYAARGGNKRRSFPIRFMTRSGVVDIPIKGERYAAP